jgi:hypothetical protein
MLQSLAPFLGNIQPAVAYLRTYKKTVTDFLGQFGFGHAGLVQNEPGQDYAPHALRILSHLSTESLSIWPNRLPTNRGNGYPGPNYLGSLQAGQNAMFENFDCKNTDYSPTGTGTGGDEAKLDEDVVHYLDQFPRGTPNDPGGAETPAQDEHFAPCNIQSPPAIFGDGRAPNVFALP